MKLREIIKSKIVKTALIVLGVYLAVLAMVYIDVVLRARSAYLEGEKYYSWHKNPELKERFLEEFKAKRLAELKKKKEKGDIDEEEYKTQIEILDAEIEWHREESSIKNSYMWYKTVIDLFQPPRSRYVRLAQEKMKITKEIWKEELASKGIKVEEYMLQ